MGLLLVIGLIGTGCARTSQNASGQVSPAEREANLEQIADDYAHDGDLSRARAALDELGLANPAQLLVTMAEQDINKGRSRNKIAGLARLAEALGIHSPRLAAYLAPTVAPLSLPPSPTPVPLTATSAPTATRPPATPTLTSVPPTETPSVTPQPPRVQADRVVNVRSGPGTDYPVVGQMQAEEARDIIGRNANGDWWRVTWDDQGQAWVAGKVVNVLGPIDAVAVAQDIPTPPPTFTPAPPPPSTELPKPAGPDFRFVGKRLWGVEENGGSYDGSSVHCGEKRQLRVIVTDAAGNPLNGVTVKAVYGNQEEEVTGSKGPGVAEFILGDGQDVYIIRDADGRQVTSDYARNMSTNPAAIPVETLMGAGFCQNAEDCAHFVSQNGCHAHYSWDVTFQRAY